MGVVYFKSQRDKSLHNFQDTWTDSTSVLKMGVFYYFLCLLGVILVGPIRGFLITTDRPSIHTPVGEIFGYSRSFHVRGTRRVALNFLGIPYAEAPTGPRRFREPVPKAAFTLHYHPLMRRNSDRLVIDLKGNI